MEFGQGLSTMFGGVKAFLCADLPHVGARNVVPSIFEGEVRYFGFYKENFFVQQI